MNDFDVRVHPGYVVVESGYVVFRSKKDFLQAYSELIGGDSILIEESNGTDLVMIKPEDAKNANSKYTFFVETGNKKDVGGVNED